MLEGGDLLDGDLLLVETVPGLDHSAVGALAQELDGLVPGSDLRMTWIKPSVDWSHCTSAQWAKLGGLAVKMFLVMKYFQSISIHLLT